MYYHAKRLFEEIPFDLRTTRLGVATIFTTLMLIVTSTTSAQVEKSDTTFFRVGSNQAVVTTKDSEPKEGIIPASYPVKTQLAAIDEKSKDDIVEYTVKKGDTIPSIAKKYIISSDTIRWVNNIWGDQVAEGTKLKILPVSGFEYKIQEGDSVRSIAKTYKAHPATIVTFNEIEADGLEKGQTIIIPDGVKAPIKKPAVSPFRAVSGNDPSGYNTVTPAPSNTPVFSGNGYPWGNCTWYVSNRRAELGRPIPNKLGNAGSWAYSASSRGLTVNKSPAVGAVMVESGKGHVAVVERINPDGSITISEMNFNWRLGFKTNRTIPSASVGYHSYIH